MGHPSSKKCSGGFCQSSMLVLLPAFIAANSLVSYLNLQGSMHIERADGQVEGSSVELCSGE